MQEYRVYGRYGQWGEVDDLEYVERDLAFCNEQYADKIAAGEEAFVIQVRDVTEWRPYGSEENSGAEEAKGG